MTVGKKSKHAVSILDACCLLILFVFYILKISMRSNMKEFDKCLDNIDNIDILNNPNRR